MQSFSSEQNITLIHPTQIQTANYQGNIKHEFPIEEVLGQIVFASQNANFLVLYTSLNLILVFDFARKEIKQLNRARKFHDNQGQSLGDIESVCVNSNGTYVVVISRKKEAYLYDVSLDTMTFIRESCVKAHFDEKDSRFLIIQSVENKQPLLNTYFYSSENGIKMVDAYPLKESMEIEEELCGLCVPHIYIIQKLEKECKIHQQMMRDFNGIQEMDDSVVSAIMDFNFHLGLGNLDEAYKSILQIQNPLVWENMAQMCVITGRLDVAENCIGNMRFARGAKAIREAKKEPEYEAKLAMVAIQLNMVSEADKLYRKCERFDLLNKMHQAAGNWEKAIDCAETSDRINLKNTYFNTARLMETRRQFQEAIKYYELSGCGNQQIPRMYLQANDMEELFNYIEQKDDKELYEWWAKYKESQSAYEEATTYYKKAEDFGSYVRLMINNNELEKAKTFCMNSNDSRASYQLAKLLEQQGLLQEAVTYYAKAQHYSRAVQLAKELNHDNEVMSLSQMAQPRIQNQSAEYFEQKGFHEKAIILYMKAKNIRKALNLAVKSKLFDYIEKITSTVGQDDDVDSLAQLAEYFIQNQQYDKAIHLLVASKQHDRARQLFTENNIFISEEIAKQLIPQEIDENNPELMQQLRMLAENANKQGNFELASRLYRQLRDNVKAMKCMCKMNDQNKVIAFAQNARNQEIYIIAANYLQSADWSTNPDIMKNILTFYTRAKAFDRLANFYETCASLEIDEHKDYDRAVTALKDAIKFWTKANEEQKSQTANQKVYVIEKYLQAKALIHSNPAQMVKDIQELAQNAMSENILKLGDLFAPVIEHYYQEKNYQSAYTYVKKLQEKKVNPGNYVPKHIIQDILNENGVKAQEAPQRSQHVNASGNKNQSNMMNRQEDDDEVFEEEDIDEEF